MRLANDLIALSDGAGHSVRLRPTLRAAVRLHAKYGLPELLQKIQAGHLGAMADTIVDATDIVTAQRLIDALQYEGIRVLAGWREPVTELVFALLSMDRSATDQDNPTAPSPEAANQSIEKHLETLFEIGTAWLGWTPAETWAASPTEILIAERGLIAKLKLLNGVTDPIAKPKFDPREEVSPEEVKESLATLRAIALQGKAA